MKVFRKDPKTGVSLVREVACHDFTPCDGCCRDQDTNGNERAMFRYGEWSADDLGEYTAIRWHDGLFCSKPCHDAHMVLVDAAQWKRK